MIEKNSGRVADTIDLSGKQLKRWVVNISKHTLTNDETTVLAKRLNFVVAPEKISHDWFLVAT